jgi:hypothetical protein
VQSTVCRAPGSDLLTDSVENAFSTSTADQAFAKCIRLGRLIGSLQHPQAERFQRLIQHLRIDTVAVMNNEPVSFIATHAFSKLLECPLACAVF